MENKIPVHRQNRDVTALHGSISEDEVGIVALVGLCQYAKHANKPLEPSCF